MNTTGMPSNDLYNLCKAKAYEGYRYIFIVDGEPHFYRSRKIALSAAPNKNNVKNIRNFIETFEEELN